MTTVIRNIIHKIEYGHKISDGKGVYASFMNYFESSSCGKICDNYSGSLGTHQFPEANFQDVVSYLFQNSKSGLR